MSSTPREIGTLIVVVLKANHLPNKRHIGKQDPYCVVSVNGEKRRTKAIKRGGQHPEWDEEVRFTLYEDVNDILERTAHGDGTPPPLPPKDDKGPKKIKGGKMMKLACFADDAREPDLIGETDVDLTEVLTKGETDEWFTLMNKDKFSGKVYLELTFWSNEPPPEKKVTPKPSKSKHYGGPGSFIASSEIPSSLADGISQPSRIVSTSSIYDHSRQSSDGVPSSLRASSSLARLDLYVPPYERRNRISPVDKIANEFAEFGVSDSHHPRESFPPRHGGYTPRPPSPSGYSALSSFPSSHGYDQNISDTASAYLYDQSTPIGTSSLQHRSSMSNPSSYASQPPYQPHYEAGPPSAYNQSPIRGPRHSIPTSSSGFMPLPNSSGFLPLSSRPSEPTGFGAPSSHTPAPTGYNSSQFHPQPTYTPIPSQMPVDVNSSPYLPPSSSASFHPQQSFPSSQSFHYSQYAIPPAVSGPPQQYTTSQPSPQPPNAQPAPPQIYNGYIATPSDNTSAPPPPQNTVSASFSSGSRPLPQQPQVVYGQPQAYAPYSLPPSGSSSSQQQLNSYSPTQSGSTVYLSSNPYQTAPPPPPPPPIQYNVSQEPQLHSINGQQTITNPPPPPPPPPVSASSSRRRSSLPQPPVNHQQPPPPPDFFAHNQPPPPPPLLPHSTNQKSLYHPGPPPNPPTPADGQGQWLPVHNAQSGYVQQGYS